MSQKKNGFLGGVAILSIAGLLSKVIGMLFRIPLTNAIGMEGLGLYQLVYPTYTMLLAVSTAGIPVAISRLVSESVALGRHRDARAVLRAALPVLSCIGLFLMILMIASADSLAAQRRNPEISVGFIALAPAVLIVSVMSAFRGFLQGHSNMEPTAVSQMIEQVGKLVFSLPLAIYGLRFGLVWAAAGALLGVSLSELLALAYVFIVYLRGRPAQRALEATQAEPPPRTRTLAWRIIRVAIPITIGSTIVPIAGYIDSAMIPGRLTAAGLGPSAATTLYGMLSGAAYTLINVPTVLATAVCVNLVPAISAARIDGRRTVMENTSMLGLRLGSLIGFPCAVGMSLLAEPIIHLIYSVPAEEIVITGQILSLSALTILPFTMVQATTGVLQGAGMQKVPMYSLVAGVVCKIILNYILVAIPSLNIYGAPLASLSCYLVSMTITLWYIHVRVGVRLRWGSLLLRPGAATLGMAAAVVLCTAVLDMSRRLNTLVAVAVGVVAYAVLAVALGVIRREDMAHLPGGRKIEALLKKLRLWR